jgi:hypothetical protein
MDVSVSTPPRTPQLAPQAVPEAEAATPPLWPGLHDMDLQALSQAVACMSAADGLVTWFPQYGCALLALRPHEAPIMAAAGAITLLLVGLDDWSFRVHRWGPAWGCRSYLLAQPAAPSTLVW